ncbi:MAG: hypothetical protein K2L27_06170 [Muribaculaceae bacterium]|nr:hypothetical protein [Muribaculaceae bacterium]
MKRATISIPGIVQSLIADSAIAATGSTLSRPPLFTPDHEPALRLACRDAFRIVALQLSAYTCAVHTDGDTPAIDLDPALAIDPDLVARSIETIVAAHVLRLMHAAAYPALAAVHAARAAAALAALHRRIVASAPAPGRIRPAP